MNTNNGNQVHKACLVLKETYSKICEIAGHIEELLMQYDPAFKMVEEFSFGGRHLRLRANHSFLFKKVKDESVVHEECVLVVICIFFDDKYLHRIALKDQPELWVGLFYI